MATDEKGRRRFAGVRRWGARILMGIGALTLFGMLLMFFAVLLLGRAETVPGRTILELDLERDLAEYVPDDPVAQAILGLREARPTVRDVVEALHRAADDDRVLGLVARVGSGDLGFAQVEEIRDAVAVFRASGKPAVLFSETFGEVGAGHGGYYLATAFERIYMQPSGDIGLTGLISESPFFAGTLDRYDVEPRLDHRYEYKNAMNIFTEREFTEPHREATLAILQSVYGNIVRAIATARGLSEEQVHTTISNGPILGEEAVRAGLVDRLAYRDEVFDSLQARVGGNAEFLFLHRYLGRAGRLYDRGETVALIYGVGGVQRGESEFNPVFGGMAMGSETVTKAFHRAIEDPSVRAIIFRIDSPGGSYVASDAIWREVVRARAAGKPVIATMGNVAASGGYFVAMPADRIIAQPSTLTGSIGVLGGKMVTRELWNRFGVTFDDVEIGGNTTFYSGVQDYTPEEWARLQAWLDRVYLDFTGKVAQGRNLTREQVHEVARGRVWTGVDAQRLGLVDDLGGFAMAIQRTREALNLAPDARIHLRVFPEERTLLEALLARDGPPSSRPEAAVMLKVLETVQPALRTAQQAGLFGAPGVLTMPPVNIR
jgi:protease IV